MIRWLTNVWLRRCYGTLWCWLPFTLGKGVGMRQIFENKHRSMYIWSKENVRAFSFLHSSLCLPQMLSVYGVFSNLSFYWWQQRQMKEKCWATTQRRGPWDKTEKHLMFSLLTRLFHTEHLNIPDILLHTCLSSEFILHPDPDLLWSIIIFTNPRWVHVWEWLVEFSPTSLCTGL